MRGQRNTNSWTADQFIKTNGFRNGVIDISNKIYTQSLKTNKNFDGINCNSQKIIDTCKKNKIKPKKE
jgi:hypothetical protein